MSERLARITDMLRELRTEIEKGVELRDIPEYLTFRFTTPSGVRDRHTVVCQFQARSCTADCVATPIRPDGDLHVGPNPWPEGAN